MHNSFAKQVLIIEEHLGLAKRSVIEMLASFAIQREVMGNHYYTGNVHLLNHMVVSSSGGKDSTVLIFLLSHMGLRLPIIYNRKATETGLELREAEYFNALTKKGLGPIIPTVGPKRKGMKIFDLIHPILVFDGTRRDEWDRVDGKSTTVVIDGVEISRQNMPNFTRMGVTGYPTTFPLAYLKKESIAAIIDEFDLPVLADCL